MVAITTNSRDYYYLWYLLSHSLAIYLACQNISDSWIFLYFVLHRWLLCRKLSFIKCFCLCKNEIFWRKLFICSFVHVLLMIQIYACFCLFRMSLPFFYVYKTIYAFLTLNPDRLSNFWEYIYIYIYTHIYIYIYIYAYVVCNLIFFEFVYLLWSSCIEHFSCNFSYLHLTYIYIYKSTIDV